MMGVPNIWIIDPETRTARMVAGDSLTATTRLEAPNTIISIDLKQLFDRLDETA